MSERSWLAHTEGSIAALVCGVARPKAKYPIFVAIDDVTVCHWQGRDEAQAWELVCLHSGLDPYCLSSPRDGLPWKLGSFTPIFPRMGLGSDQRDPREQLVENFASVEAAIRAGALSARATESSEPLASIVQAHDFRSWAGQVRLARSGPWLSRGEFQLSAAPAGNSSAHPNAWTPREFLLHRRNHWVVPEKWIAWPNWSPMRDLLEDVIEKFWDRWEFGGASSPREGEILAFLREREGKTDGLGPKAKVFWKLLSPADRPKGRRLNPIKSEWR